MPLQPAVCILFTQFFKTQNGFLGSFFLISDLQECCIIKKGACMVIECNESKHLDLHDFTVLNLKPLTFIMQQFPSASGFVAKRESLSFSNHPDQRLCHKF